MDKIVRGLEGLLQGEDKWRDVVPDDLTIGEVILMNDGLRKEIHSLFHRSDELLREQDILNRRIRMFEDDYKHNKDMNRGGSKKNILSL